MSRGPGRCGTFQLGWQREQTTAGSGAGACRLQSGAFSDAALPPQGQGALPVCGIDAVCPVGAKALQSGAPDFGGVAGESRELGRFAHQERLAGAPGDGEGAAAFYNFSYPQKPAFRPFRTPCFSYHPAGGTAGSARTRSRDSSLENPFWGNRPSPNVAGGKSPARGLAAVCAHSGPKRNESQPICPLLVGQTGVYFEPTALAAGPAGTAARSMLRAFWQVSVRIQSRSPRSIRRSACTPSGPAMPT